MVERLSALHLRPINRLWVIAGQNVGISTLANIVVKRRLIVITALCLVILATRLGRLPTLEMDRDEIWSIWQTFGTPAQIINWTPPDWPPLYYLLVGGWRVLTGIDPFAVRLMSLFVFLPGMALLYRIGCKLFDDTTALIAVAACAAMGYVIHISIMVRAYSLMFTLTMLVWWFALKYFEKPSIRYGVALGLTILTLFYTHFTTIFPVAMIGLFMLVLYPRRFWRWWLPLAIAGIGVLPQFLAKASMATGRAGTGFPILEAWLASGAYVYRQNLSDVLEKFAGYSLVLWAVFVFIAGVLIVSRYGLRRNVLALLVWMLGPVIFFFAVMLDAFSDRHFIWVTAGIALWIGWGISQMPKAAIAAFLIVFVIVMSGPVPITESYKGVDTPLVEAFTYLGHNLQAGDVVLIDPNVTVVPEEWDYFTRAYFPSGLQWVHTPQDYRRVWYFSVDGKQDTDTYAAVQHNRSAGEPFEAEGLSLRLYEQPPSLQGVLFENGMRFNGAEILDQPGPIPVLREGETLRVRMWWSVDQAVKLDYSVGTYVLAQTGMVAQFDGPPQLKVDPRETSRWLTGRYYIEERDIVLPTKMAAGSYSVLLSVYQWWDSKRMSAPGTNADTVLPILTFQIKAW